MVENSNQEQKFKIIAAIPCFNEERFIGSVVAKAKKYVDRVIVIDDGSTDDSAEIAKSAGATVYRHEENRGYGAAIASALERGRSKKADILVILDGDGQHDPK
ncbi:MAG: glycosyltransferase family 2 protein, partial [Planctomycetes bacterium]|nr:glycosyltransferase family 2 protein [Planctomycetota bacterium]